VSRSAPLTWWPAREDVVPLVLGAPLRAYVRLDPDFWRRLLVTGAAALVGGLLLAAAPDGSLLSADPAVLAGSPFADYRWPGVLLATLVGGGYLLTGW